MALKNITDDEIWDSIVSYDTERMLLNKVKKLPDDIIKTIFQYVKSPFYIEIKNEIGNRIKDAFRPPCDCRNHIALAKRCNCSNIRKNKRQVRGNNWRYLYQMDKATLGNETNLLFKNVYPNRFYGIILPGYPTYYGICHHLSMKKFRKIGNDNNVKGRSKKEIIQKLMKL